MRFAAYCLFSSVLTSLVILLALINRPNFYSAAISVYKNSASLLVIFNQALIIALMIGKGLQLIFFGSLRELELQHLYERAFFAVTESFLVLTVFKDEFELQFTLFFGCLLFLRVFHWIISDRVDLMFQFPNPPSLLTHFRLCSAILICGIVDVTLIRYCVTHSPTGVLIMFAFEFALLSNSLLLACGRYLLNVVGNWILETHPEDDAWEQKSLWTFVIETTADSTRLLTYIAFFFVILKPYGLPPLHILRDVYVTIVSLITRVFDFIKARKAQAAMDSVFQDAHEHDLERDNVCIICREDMAIDTSLSHRAVPKKLPCNHVIHYGCLKSWLERSQRCPICRRAVLASTREYDTATAVGNEGNVQLAVPEQPQTDGQVLNPEAVQAPVFPEVMQTVQLESENMIELPRNVVLPMGWRVLKMKNSEENGREIKLAAGQWAKVLQAR